MTMMQEQREIRTEEKTNNITMIKESKQPTNPSKLVIQHTLLVNISLPPTLQWVTVDTN
jgi:hypothetical protein